MRPYHTPRLVFAIALLLLIPTVPRADQRAPVRHPEPDLQATISPQSGPAPLTIEVTGYADVAYGYSIDWGDGEILDATNPTYFEYPIDAQHTYPCRGDYQCRVFATVFDHGQIKHLEITKSVGVGELAPDPSISARVIGDTPIAWMIILLEDEVSPETISRATVEWGDGSPIETFTWRYDGGLWMTPNHNIEAEGSFVATVRDYYVGGDCSTVRTASAPWSVGTATGTETTTWGRIKELYR